MAVRCQTSRVSVVVGMLRNGRSMKHMVPCPSMSLSLVPEKTLGREKGLKEIMGNWTGVTEGTDWQRLAHTLNGGTTLEQNPSSKIKISPMPESVPVHAREDEQRCAAEPRTSKESPDKSINPKRKLLRFKFDDEIMMSLASSGGQGLLEDEHAPNQFKGKGNIQPVGERITG